MLAPPTARNTAMDIAQGKYYYFMDSDDWAEPTMLQDMYELAEKHQLQLVVAGYYIDTYMITTITLQRNYSSGPNIWFTARVSRTSLSLV